MASCLLFNGDNHGAEVPVLLSEAPQITLWLTSEENECYLPKLKLCPKAFLKRAHVDSQNHRNDKAL